MGYYIARYFLLDLCLLVSSIFAYILIVVHVYVPFYFFILFTQTLFANESMLLFDAFQFIQPTCMDMIGHFVFRIFCDYLLWLTLVWTRILPLSLVVSYNQTERAFQKQPTIFHARKGGLKKSESRWFTNPGFVFKVPREVR